MPSTCRVYSPKKETVFVVACLLPVLLFTGLALYARAGQLEARREALKQADLRAAAEASAQYWQEKYNKLRYARPLTPAQRALVRKWEKMQLK